MLFSTPTLTRSEYHRHQQEECNEHPHPLLNLSRDFTQFIDAQRDFDAIVTTNVLSDRLLAIERLPSPTSVILNVKQYLMHGKKLPSTRNRVPHTSRSQARAKQMATPRITRSQAARSYRLRLATSLDTSHNLPRRRVETDAGPVIPSS